MSWIARILVGLVALIHGYLAWLEIFAWTSRGPKIFTIFPEDFFAPTTSLAANQGLYNAFLAAGLVWALAIKDVRWQRNIAVCFLLFVAVAGAFGAATITGKAIFSQTIPALAALGAIMARKPPPAR